MPAPQEPGGGLGADNKGQQLLAKMGWKPGQAIGGSGGKAAAAPAAPAAPPSGGGGGGGGLGLGALPHGAVEEDDDEFTRYRKRSERLEGRGVESALGLEGCAPRGGVGLCACALRRG